MALPPSLTGGAQVTRAWLSPAVVHTTMQPEDGSELPVDCAGWPTVHDTEEDANEAALAWAKRQVRLGRWNGEPTSTDFQSLDPEK